MSEKEIRRVLKEFCVDLDKHAKRVLKKGVRKIVIPTVLGAGLALSSGGCGERYIVDEQKGLDASVPNESMEIGAPHPAYGVPVVEYDMGAQSRYGASFPDEDDSER